MLIRQKDLLAGIFFLTILLGMNVGKSYAGETIKFGPHEAKIEGAIKYSLIGSYRAHFNDFKGRITFDERSRQIGSVYLEIEAGSIRSDHPWCDKIARSRRLLYALRYPKIIFKSDKIIQDKNGTKDQNKKRN